jgi:hypothetical protein
MKVRLHRRSRYRYRRFPELQIDSICSRSTAFPCDSKVLLSFITLNSTVRGGPPPSLVWFPSRSLTTHAFSAIRKDYWLGVNETDVLREAKCSLGSPPRIAGFQSRLRNFALNSRHSLHHKKTLKNTSILNNQSDEFRFQVTYGSCKCRYPFQTGGGRKHRVGPRSNIENALSAVGAADWFLTKDHRLLQLGIWNESSQDRLSSRCSNSFCFCLWTANSLIQII